MSSRVRMYPLQLRGAKEIPTLHFPTDLIPLPVPFPKHGACNLCLLREIHLFILAWHLVFFQWLQLISEIFLTYVLSPKETLTPPHDREGAVFRAWLALWCLYGVVYGQFTNQLRPGDSSFVTLPPRSAQLCSFPRAWIRSSWSPTCWEPSS